MNQEIIEWLLLLGRWLHITVAIAWIGNSFFFMWLDRSFEPNGELWMVHGGGFYKVEKHKMGPTKVPEILHWFKWESYWTWFSGIFLLTLIFYTGGGTFLLDSSVSSISYFRALGLSIGALVVSWFFYDSLWESKLTRERAWIGHSLTLLWFAGMSYFLCHLLSGRAAYMHIGGLLGTWMTANVFLRIIPRQVKMVEASKKGESVNQEWGKNAKNRSTHNTYFTLPVIFIMLSNHFPSTYGSPHNWIILLGMSAAGAAIREYFVQRLKNPIRSKIFASLGAFLILVVIFLSSKNLSLYNTETPSSPQLITHQLSGDPHSGGSLNGVVNFEGPPPLKRKIELPLTCTGASKSESYADDLLVKDGKVKNALVRITKGIKTENYRNVPQTPVILDQRGCLYEPRIIVARVGQRVEILNSDSTFHNVKSISKNNDNFNDAMPMKNQRIVKVFTKPEIVIETKCSVHPWMSAFIAVVEHPFYSLTDETGTFSIANVPPGHYTLEVWHETLGSQTKELDLGENGKINTEFTLRKREKND